jgi:hypothetical protein
VQTIADHTRGFIKRVASALLGVVLGVLVGNLPQKLAAKFKEVVKGIRDLVRKLIKSLLQKLKKIFGRKGAEGQTDPEGEAPACVHITVRNSGTPQRPGRRESCFPAGTRLDDGRDGLPIESVQRGQRIPAFDQRTGQWRTDAVAETFQREYTGPMVTLRLPGETLRATARHPFWVVRGAGLDERPVTEELGTDNAPGARPGRWVEAQHLRPGDVLAGRRGEVAVEGVSVGEESLTVYNLHVAECRTHAVGACGVVVHNQSVPTRQELIREAKQYRQQKQLTTSAIRLATRRIKSTST